MAWVYIDDQFPDHPKVVAAGDAAAWLFVCGLAYCKRYATAGRIPKGQVAKLTGARSPAKLARTLVAVVLWEDDGTHYVVHDFDDWNKPQASRTESARKAAKARWDKQAKPPPDADAHADAMPDASGTHSRSTAEGDAPGCPPPLTQLLTFSDNSRRLSGDASDDDDAPRIAVAVTLLAQRDLDNRQAAPGTEPIGDPEAWLREATTRRSERDTQRLLELAELDPDATPEQLADALDHTDEAPPATPTGKPSPLDGQQAAARQRQAQGTAQVAEILATPPADPDHVETRLAEARQALPK